MEWVSEKYCQAETQLGVGDKARVVEPSRLRRQEAPPPPHPPTPIKEGRMQGQRTDSC